MTTCKPITMELSTIYENGRWSVSGAFTVTSAKGADALLRTLEIAKEFLAENAVGQALDRLDIAIADGEVK